MFINPRSPALSLTFYFFGMCISIKTCPKIPTPQHFGTYHSGNKVNQLLGISAARVNKDVLYRDLYRLAFTLPTLQRR